MEHSFGLLTLIPAVVVIVLALFTKLAIESLIVGVLIGFGFIAPFEGWFQLHTYLLNVFSLFTDAIQNNIKNESYQYVALVCFLYGALIELVVKSGGMISFEKMVLKKTNSPKKILLTSWVFGTLLFIDDYLSALMNGTTMRNITDKFKISRELLAFVVSSTAISICIIVPVSTWTIFLGKILEDAHFAPPTRGLYEYIKVIPFAFYGWIQFLLVPLVIMRVIPIFGTMKKAQDRSLHTGQTIPKNSESFQMQSTLFNETANNKIWTLFMPIFLSIAFTIFFKFDALKGVLMSLFITSVVYAITKVCRFNQIAIAFVDGSKSMLYGLVLLLLSFTLKDVGDQMGLTKFVIDGISTSIPREYLPALMFICLGLIAFATGNSFGLYAIAIPMVLPLAQLLGINPHLCIGVVVSAGAFGAHACFYSDGTIMAAYGTACNSFAHALSQLPYASISFIISLILYLVMGFIL